MKSVKKRHQSKLTDSLKKSQLALMRKLDKQLDTIETASTEPLVMKVPLNNLCCIQLKICDSCIVFGFF